MSAASTRKADRLSAMGIVRWRARAQPVAPNATGVSDAVSVASAASDSPALGALASLRSEVAACERCELHASRTQTVFGVGNEQAQLMIVGEAPGAEEDARGEPFVGRAGQLLDLMLRAIGLSRDDVYIANILKCRPPRNRDPRPQEVAACSSYLNAQIAQVDPALLLALGRVAAQNLLNVSTPIGKLRNRDHLHADSGKPVLVTYHPAYLLRSPLEKRKAYADLCAVRRQLESLR